MPTSNLNFTMKNFIKLGTIILGAVFTLSACTKDDSSGNGKLSYRVNPSNFTSSIGVIASGSGLPVITNSNSSITWTSAGLNITEIDFEAESNNTPIEYELKQAIKVDLLNLSPVLGSITLPVGTYDEVELKILLRKSTTSEIPLTIKGSYTDPNGVKVPLAFYLNEDIDIEVEAEDIVIDGKTDYTGMINVQLNKFLTNVVSADLSGATRTNGIIVISATSNVDLYTKLKANLNVFADCDFED